MACICVAACASRLCRARSAAASVPAPWPWNSGNTFCAISSKERRVASGFAQSWLSRSIAPKPPLLWSTSRCTCRRASSTVPIAPMPASLMKSIMPYAQGSTKGDVRRTVEHPVVRRDPATGRKGLFLSTGALRLTGVTEAESRALLPFLLAHASSPNYTIRYHCHPADFVIWDNQATWHSAIDDYGSGRRAYRKVIGV